MTSSRRPRGAAFACGLILGLWALGPATAAEEAHEEAAPVGPAAAAAAPAPAAAAAPDRAKPEAGKPEVAKPEAAKPGDTAQGLAPYQALRSLQVLQNQVAHGNATAQAAQPKMLAHVADLFASADPAVWKEPRNAEAAALYLFSAGRAKTVRALAERGVVFAPERDRLVKGAIAYAEGQDDVARALLGTYDPRTLPRGLGGHLALVLATLYAGKDAPRADALLDTARLLVPGTLVEEAALRRQVFLLADVVSLDKFAALSRQYLRRFRGSIFAATFKTRLTSFAVRLAVAGDVAELSKIDPAFAELPQAERRSIYLTLSRDALLAGRSDAARYASARALALSPDAAETERARLYTAAAGVATDASPTGRAALAALDRVRLSPRDAELRDAAAAVASSIDAGLNDPGHDLGREGPAPEASGAALIERANRVMAASDAILAVDPGLPRSPEPVPPPAAADANGRVP